MKTDDGNKRRRGLALARMVMLGAALGAAAGQAVRDLGFGGKLAEERFLTAGRQGCRHARQRGQKGAFGKSRARRQDWDFGGGGRAAFAG